MAFQFKEHFIPMILAELKTQTRRRVKPGDELVREIQPPLKIGEFHPDDLNIHYAALRRNGRLWHYTGQRNAVQPGRGKPADCHIIIENIWFEDVRTITHENAIADGFPNKIAFLQFWCDHYYSQLSPVVKEFAFDVENPDVVPMRLYRGMPFDIDQKVFEGWAFQFHVERSL